MKDQLKIHWNKSRTDIKGVGMKTIIQLTIYQIPFDTAILSFSLNSQPNLISPHSYSVNLASVVSEKLERHNLKSKRM